MTNILHEAEPADTREPEIQALAEQLDSLVLDARAAAEHLTDDQFNWRAAPRRWSVGQCLQHITMTTRLYSESVARMTAEARAREAQGARPLRESAFSRWFVNSMEPPPKLRIRTFGKVEPAPRLDRDAVLRDFEAVHREMAQALNGVTPNMLRQAKTRSPFLPLLQFTFGQVYHLNLAHGRRHLWQARQVLADPAFGS
jgi:hypothetical protein